MPSTRTDGYWRSHGSSARRIVPPRSAGSGARAEAHPWPTSAATARSAADLVRISFVGEPFGHGRSIRGSAASPHRSAVRRRWPGGPPPSTLPSREGRMAEAGGGEVVWRPTRDYAERTRLARFMRSLGIGSLEELQRRSVADPDWYWDAVVRALGVRFTQPYTKVRDVSRGLPWPRWFEGGRLNFADNCVDRHLDAGRGQQPAIVWEGDDGRSRVLTYRELSREVNQLANALKRLGVGEGDRVGVFLPMSPEAAIATLAVVRIGAIYTPCFSGYGAQAVASRLQDCEAKVLLTADGFYRRGQVVKMKETADAAAAASPSVEHVVVYKRLGREIPWTQARDHWWHELIGKESGQCPAVPVDFDRPCLIIYTSGTTGRPKAAVLTQGGFLVKCAHDFGYLMDVGPGDRLFWLTELS